jgi:hypothetical protein
LEPGNTREQHATHLELRPDARRLRAAAATTRLSGLKATGVGLPNVNRQVAASAVQISGL